MEIEEMIFSDDLPVNTIAMLNRALEILKENDTNSATLLSPENDGLLKFRKVMWLINAQVYGQLEVIDMAEEWKDFSRIEVQRTKNKKAQKLWKAKQNQLK